MIEHPRYHADVDPDRQALVMAETGESLSYGELADGAARCARMLNDLGCRQGDTIAILSENNLAFMELCWAAKDSGLHYACISTRLNAPEAAYIVENSGARVLIASGEMTDLARRASASLPTETLRLVVGGAAPGFQHYEPLRDAREPRPLTDRVRGASMLYSSGTTGRPKGIRTPLQDVPPTEPPLRHRLLANFFGLDDKTVFLNPGPFYHAAPLRTMMAVQRLGGTAIGFERFDAETVLLAMQQFSATHGFFVPTMFTQMLKLPAAVRDAVDISSMRCAIHGAAPCPIAVKEAMMDWWGPVLYELYGGTEGVGHFFIGPGEWVQKKGSVGRAARGCVVRIVDSQGRERAPNEPGLIYMGNGREFEYHGDEAGTREVRTDDGLVTMGDIGYLDEDGYLFLTDRKSHTIISGGVNIYPQEVENILIEHPAIDDVAVIGVPNEEFGEEVKAVVVPGPAEEDREVLAEDIIAWCRSRLSPVKCPRSVDFVEQLPRSDAGKLLKRIVRAPYWKGRDSCII